jgi:hypothetical protein
MTVSRKAMLISSLSSNICSSAAVGYSPIDVIAQFQPGFASGDSGQIEGYTKAMVLHPIATGFNFIAFLLSLRPGFVTSLCASLAAALGFILTLVSMAIDVTWFNMLGSDVTSGIPGANVYYAAGFATLVTAFALSVLGSVIVLFTCCASRKKHKAHKHHNVHGHHDTHNHKGEETIVTTTTTTTTTPGGHATKHKHRRHCFCCRWF